MQQVLFDRNAPEPPPVPVIVEVPIKVRWLRFVTENPDVPRVLVRMARERVAAGDGYVSMRGLFEELRRRPDLIAGDDQINDGRRVKLNNNFTRLATELVLQLAPELRKYFRTR